jgi:plasmid stabilization system protein ParE
MARIELAPELTEDFDRILEHLLAHEAADAASRVAEVIRAIDILEQNPLIGRPVQAGLRELVIGRGSRGYVALYRYVEELDIVFVLANSRAEGAGIRPRSALRARWP